MSTMSEQGKSERVATDPSSNITISYCPDLKIYHYTKVGEPECLFTTEQLVEAMDDDLKGGRKEQAEVMALLTGCARQYPHQVVSFDADGKCTISPSEKG